MFNLRQRHYHRVNNYSGSTVNLSIAGPRNLIRTRALITAQLTDTWLDVFNQQLNLRLNAKDSYFVTRTQPRNAPRPRDGKGWECRLDEQVGVFVNKFMRNRQKHTAVLVRRRNNRRKIRALSTSSSSSSSSSSEPPSLTPEVPLVDIGPISMSTANVKVEVGGQREGIERHGSLSSLRIDEVVSLIGNTNLEEGVVMEGPSTSRAVVREDGIVNDWTRDRDWDREEMGEEEEDDDEEGHEKKRQRLEWGRDDDMDSLATGVGMQLSVLHEKGIPVEEVRAKFEEQMKNCTNKLVLGVIADVIKQQEKPSWEGLVQKMPSVCLFLDKLVNKSD